MKDRISIQMRIFIIENLIWIQRVFFFVKILLSIPTRWGGGSIENLYSVPRIILIIRSTILVPRVVVFVKNVVNSWGVPFIDNFILIPREFSLIENLISITRWSVFNENIFLIPKHDPSFEDMISWFQFQRRLLCLKLYQFLWKPSFRNLITILGLFR